MTDCEILRWNDGELTGLSVRKANAAVKKTVILLHGYMGDAESNTAFAKSICAACPQTEVVVIDGLAPVPPENDPAHRQWYPLPETADEDGYLYSFMPYYLPAEKQKQIRESTPLIQKAAETLNGFILKYLKRNDRALSDCFLCGISQGGITAYDMLLFRKELHRNDTGRPLAGLIIIGAGINESDRLNAIPHGSLPAVPVLMARGRRDEIFPKTVYDFSAAQLRLQKLYVETAEADSVHFGLEHAVCDAVCDFIRRNG